MNPNTFDHTHTRCPSDSANRPDRSDLPVDSSRSDAELPCHATIHELVEAQVRRTPEAVAVVYENEHVSYAEVNRLANRLAARLRQLGVGGGTLVGLFLERSPDLVVGILGVLKAGAAYVPLDPDTPRGRIRHMLDDTQLPLVLTHSRLRPQLPESTGNLICLDDEPDLNNGVHSRDPEIAVDPDQLAYVVYTSGSTGRPKGVRGRHRGVVNYLAAYLVPTYGLGSDDVVLQIPSFGFDASLRDLIGPLTAGGRVVLLRQTDAREPSAMISAIRRQRVTCLLSMVPSVLNTLLDAAEHEAALDSVRLILVSGEPLQLSACRRARDVFGPQAEIVNQYGATECTMTSTFHRISALDPDHGIATVGRPIPNCRVHVLDADQNPVPAGTCGEIHIGGVGVTGGYWNQPELSAQKIIADPFGPDSGERLYKTGDLGRYRADGNIELLGRLDRQVKIGGIRVEIGEIESALLRHEAVRECVVLPYSPPRSQRVLIAKQPAGDEPAEETVPDDSGSENRRLVAYVACREDVPAKQFRSFLADDLPKSMIPAQFIRVDALPLNVNGKVDLAALPQPDNLRPELTVAYAAPQSGAEKLVTGIWQEVLDIDGVGVNDSFVELGGDSLSAMRIINRVRKHSCADVSVRELFEAQTAGELAELIDGQHPQPAVLPAPAAAGNGRVDGRLPLSLAEQGLWFLWKMEPQSAYYTCQGIVHLYGELDAASLERAWNALIRRHDVLRVRFETEDGRPVQTFASPPPVTLPVLDLSRRSPDECSRDMQRAARREIEIPFDLERDPLWRFRLFKISDREHALLLTMHEITVDLWTIRLLLRDLAALYQAERNLEPAGLPELAVNFREFVQWEKEHITRARLEPQERYWRQQLAGELPVLDLPLDRPRPRTLSYRGRSMSAVVDEDLTERLNALSRSNDATLFMTLLSAFDVLLGAYSGQDDLIVGAPLANRNLAEAEDIAGFFLTMLPLRADLSGDPGFLELLGRLRDTVTGGLANADYPFLWMLEWANVVRDASISPIFQVMFNMLSFPDQSLKNSDLEITYRSLETGYTKYDLALYAQEHDGCIHLQMSYLSEVFDDETIDRLLKNYLTLLESIVQDPHAPISSLGLVSPPEEQRLFVDFNRTDRDNSDGRCLHQLFERQAEQTPDAPALVMHGRTLSYRALNEQANRVARSLSRAGVGPETRVALCVHRSFDMLAALLGVMKAGGTYVALDPAYPRRRLEEILADTAAACLVLHKDLDEFSDYPGTKLFLDADAEAIAGEEAANLENRATPETALNIVYTSSTTGKPKGVVISGRAVLNRLQWMWDDYPFQPGDVAVWHKSYALVASTWECFGALLKGIPTVIVSRDELLDPPALWNTLVDNGVSYLLATPALLGAILDRAERDHRRWTALRLATTSAEPIPPALVSRWKRVFPGVPLLNLYGSSECASNVTVFNSVTLVDGEPRVPVGKPLPNTKVYVLNRRLRPVPIGGVGEMCVSGACVAEGYVNLPELTQQRFVANPYSGDPQSRLYRTGDLARFRSDGNLELIGRRDAQVKIRGFRVEPAEIEAAIVGHASVRECAVVLYGDGDLGGEDRRRLIAYVAADDDLSPSVLRRFLAERLPDFMIPAEFIRLESLPRNDGGKVDRRALPEPDIQRPDLDADYVPPGTDVETLLAGLWSDVLGIERIGVNDNFFDLGGHSLQAAQLASRISDSMGRDLSVRSLITHPTIAGQAETLGEQPRATEAGDRQGRQQTANNQAESPATGGNGQSNGREHAPHLHVENRPLLSLCMSGKLGRVDSAALGCVPRELLIDPQNNEDDAIQAWGDGMPVLSSIAQTGLGRMAVIKLPFFSSGLYKDQRAVVDAAVDALEMAAQLGARTVSLTGLIPSATDYGRAIVERISGRDDFPAVSTGHTTTVSAVVLAVKRIVGEAGRSLAHERVGFLGLGSIGQASLRLMLNILPHPAEIALCDVYSKLDALESIRRQIQSEHGYQGPVRVIESHGQVPESFYNNTLVVGATNVPDILDVSRLAPGTLIVDDSSPHCFATREAVERFQEQEDILFTEGGVLESPEPIHQVRYLPRAAERLMGAEARERFLRYNPHQITGCIFSSLLSSCFAELRPTVGFVSDEDCLLNVERLGELGFQAATLHSGDFALADDVVRRFRERFSAPSERNEPAPTPA